MALTDSYREELSDKLTSLLLLTSFGAGEGDGYAVKCRRYLSLECRHRALWFSESVASWAAKAYSRECAFNERMQHGTNT